MIYTLYKHPFQDDTLAIVRYCHHKGIICLPIICVERNHGISEDLLPAIKDHDTDTWYYGTNEVIRFYQLRTGLDDILHRALKFQKTHPDYVVHHNPI
jgi:hypothetical protein